jgi:DNA-binding beta-propeller fold protein YncE
VLLADIRKFRKEINDQLDRLEKNSVDEIEEKVKCLEDKIEESLKQLQAHKAKVTSANDKLASPNQNQAEVFVYVQIAEDAANAANKCIVDTRINCTLNDLEFHPHNIIPEDLEQNETLGTLSEKPTSFQIKGQQSYCVKVESDEQDCYITGACCMEDGTIILADSLNNKLKRLHSYKYTVIDYCHLPAYPNQVCMISNTQVAVTVPSKQEVHFVSLVGQMKSTNKIMTDFECYGLAYTNNNLYISDGNTSVYMYTLPGRKLKQFSKTQSGQKLFSDIRSLAVSKDGTRIYVADYHNGLIVLDNNGQVITTYNGEQLQIANCCYITEEGSVLVSGIISNNVLQFTPDGELIGEVIDAQRGKGGISSVICNQQMSRTCISRYYDYNIEVYYI